MSIFDNIDKFYCDPDHPLYFPLKKAVVVIEDALRIFGIDQLAVSFNGGKDATVVLHLLRYTLSKHNLLEQLGNTLPIIYFDDPK
jgi:3'-phosphoadenosine 5'-phosphosulfate sulfotransferase (PAPS reductase)/FAD synthetase